MFWIIYSLQISEFDHIFTMTFFITQIICNYSCLVWIFERKACIYEIYQLYMITLKSAPLSFGPSVIGCGESPTVSVLYTGCSLVLISARVFLYSWYLCTLFWSVATFRYYMVLSVILFTLIISRLRCPPIISVSCIIMIYFWVLNMLFLFISVYLLSLSDVMFDTPRGSTFTNIHETETVE